MPEKSGCVYLRPSDPELGQPEHGWWGHWERETADQEGAGGVSWREALRRGWVEEGHWASVEEAIAWGRERSQYVLIQLDPADLESTYSAGDIHYAELGGPYLDEESEPVRGHTWPSWPPPSEVWSGDKT